MKIGTKFTFYSNGKHRKALFLEFNNENIKCVLCDDIKTQGIKLEINRLQVIDSNQISMFCI